MKPPPMLIAEASTAVAAKPCITRSGGKHDVNNSTVFNSRHKVQHQAGSAFLPRSPPPQEWRVKFPPCILSLPLVLTTESQPHS